MMVWGKRRPASVRRVTGKLGGAGLVVGVLALPVATIDVQAAPAACPAQAIRVSPGARIQDAVDRAPPGASFCLAAGRHRMQMVTPRARQSFFGEPGTVLDGSRRITDFRPDGPFWRAAGQPEPLGGLGSCMDGRPCTRRAALFRDGAPLLQVERRAELRPGTFLFDLAGGAIIVADDPAGHVIETARMAVAFAGTADDVRISGLVIEKYNTLAQNGAVQGAAGRGWRVEHSEFRFNSGAGVVVGSGGRIAECDAHHNGQLGIGATGQDIVIENNRVWANNTAGFDPDWEAGGVKVSKGRTIVFRGNTVSDNLGPGLWCDIDCEEVVFEGNTVSNNQGPGIFFEISSGAVVRSNVLSRNGAGPQKWVWGAEIQVAASDHVDVSANTLTVRPGGHGIILVDQGRERARGGYYRTGDNAVHDNVTTFDGSGRSGGTSDVPPGKPNAGIIQAGDNRFDGNVYIHGPQSEPTFLWGPDMTFPAFRRAGQEARGTMRMEGAGTNAPAAEAPRADR